MKKMNRRPVIGMFCGNYHSDHPVKLVKILYEMLKDEDVDVRYYLGTESSSFLDSMELDENRFDYQYASLFGYSRYDNLDAIIISYGTISIYQHEQLQTFLNSLPHVPTIILEDERTPQGCCSVVIDNREGIWQMVKHLVEVHHIKKPAFITGPLRNPEAMIRFQAFRDAVKHYGIDVPESRIVYGDFSPHIDPLIEDLLKREPDIDAIISSDDDMALSADRVLRKHGLNPGKDIALTGFDNAMYAEHMSSPLTTVDQNLKQVVQEAVQLAKEAVKGKTGWDQRTVMVKPQPVYRTSCGCHEFIEVKDEPEAVHKADVSALNNAEIDSWVNALLLRELLLQSNDQKNFYRALGKQLGSLGVRHSSICLMEKAQSVPENEKVVYPSSMCLVMKQDGAEVKTYDMDNAPRIQNGQLESIVQGDAAEQTFTFLLFYQERQYGIFSVCCHPDEVPYYYGMSLEIGTGIRFANLMHEQSRLYAQLQDRNQILDFTAQHDTLTKLYNRTGVMRKMLEMLHQNESGHFAALMADLDHLKQINDTFGHLEGDFAITTTAGFLKDALPAGGILGRTGGDEFLMFIPLSSSEEKEEKKEVEHVTAHIRENQDAFEKASDKPYYINVSIGYTLFDSSEMLKLQAVVSRADASLYEVKKKRKASVIR